MALDFPTGQPNGHTYTDDCGNIWVYDSTLNSWTIDPPEFEFPDVDPDTIVKVVGAINSGSSAVTEDEIEKK